MVAIENDSVSVLDLEREGLASRTVLVLDPERAAEEGMERINDGNRLD
jgi:hypothetical protein